MVLHPLTALDPSPNALAFFGPILLFVLGVVIFGWLSAREPGPAVESVAKLEKGRKRLSFYFSVYWLFGFPLLVAWIVYLVGD